MRMSSPSPPRMSSSPIPPKTLSMPPSPRMTSLSGGPPLMLPPLMLNRPGFHRVSMKLGAVHPFGRGAVCQIGDNPRIFVEFSL